MSGRTKSNERSHLCLLVIIIHFFHFCVVKPTSLCHCETVRFELSRYDLSVWSEEENAWIAPERNGRYEVFVGASSRDFRLRGSFALI